MALHCNEDLTLLCFDQSYFSRICSRRLNLARFGLHRLCFSWPCFSRLGFDQQRPLLLTRCLSCDCLVESKHVVIRIVLGT